MAKRKIIPYILLFAAALLLGTVFSAYSGKEVCISEKIITTPPEELNLAEAAPLPEEASGVINLNTATAAELMSLNGIGKKTAERIIRFREENGNFEVIEDIMKIPGIGGKKFEEIKENITV